MLAGLQQLPELSRAELLMYAVDGMPYEQIAQVLKLSLPAVKVRIHRARLALAQSKHEI
jgi:RNA polymerase sigma-70 factor (ECF subfamily)